jgi:hypothetical protein
MEFAFSVEVKLRKKINNMKYCESPFNCNATCSKQGQCDYQYVENITTDNTGDELKDAECKHLYEKVDKIILKFSSPFTLRLPK